MATELPPELCSQIALYVALPDLPAFTLVCKRAAEAGVPVLYRHILFSPRTPRSVAVRLFATLAANKELASLAKSLSIDWEPLPLRDCQQGSDDQRLLLTNLKNTLNLMTNLEFLLLSRQVDLNVLDHDICLPSLTRLDAAFEPPATFLSQHAAQLLDFRCIPEDLDSQSTRICVPINFTSLQHLSTTVDIAESLLKNDQCNPQLRSMVLHAKVRNIAFPSCPFYTLLAEKCALLQSLCLVDWAPPAYNDESLPPAAPHHGLRTLGLYLTYCYCVADMTCPHGAFVWEGFVGAVAPVFPNIEVLQYPCAPEFGGVEDREHLPSHMSLTTWKAPEGYAKHLPRLHTVRLGNGLVYSRNEGGEFTLAHAGEPLEPPFIGIPRPLHPWVRN
ncbi:hypothetical protein AURDEDRAFT_188368 [Auricularia subglabra TFB-10046 SS5]|uniref:F-box domain-containing protein n=1 Tax=Auricularia subglabra (strain TFB-10046 / SS5) TaxID=717982 RepID=J0WTB2_AURST|nr:hypothetical protein AURDEDRAFT_188368 [Auricularia subglabra TFB-10046 SS5]